jgi:hypothetical protein
VFVQWNVQNLATALLSHPSGLWFPVPGLRVSSRIQWRVLIVGYTTFVAISHFIFISIGTRCFISRCISEVNSRKALQGDGVRSTGDDFILILLKSSGNYTYHLL